jgi:hypothetical protein
MTQIRGSAQALDMPTDAVVHGLALMAVSRGLSGQMLCTRSDYEHMTNAGILLHTFCRCASTSGALSFWPRCFRASHVLVLGIVSLQEAS